MDIDVHLARQMRLVPAAVSLEVEQAQFAGPTRASRSRLPKRVTVTRADSPAPHRACARSLVALARSVFRCHSCT